MQNGLHHISSTLLLLLAHAFLSFLLHSGRCKRSAYKQNIPDNFEILIHRISQKKSPWHTHSRPNTKFIHISFVCEMSRWFHAFLFFLFSSIAAFWIVKGWKMKNIKPKYGKNNSYEFSSEDHIWITWALSYDRRHVQYEFNIFNDIAFAWKLYVTLLLCCLDDGAGNFS